MAWPVLMAYMQNGIAVPYNGRWNSRELTQFVRALMNPMKRFSNPDELLTVMASHDAVVVSFVDLLVHRSYFSNFYKTAVKWIEKDPNQEVVFGVVTGDARKQFGVEATPVVRMYLWNDTVVSKFYFAYPLDSQFLFRPNRFQHWEFASLVCTARDTNLVGSYPLDNLNKCESIFKNLSFFVKCLWFQFRR